MQIKETYVNATEDHIFGEGPWIDAYTDNRGELFRSLQQEYGRCISKIYTDPDSVPVGWVFQKRDRYEDSNDFYLREVWVEVRERTG